jgi:starch phosphorylase
MLVERVRELVLAGVPFDEAASRVRATSVFTTHTPVPAGHDAFNNDQVAECTGPIWEQMNATREQVLGFGRHPVENHGQFHMTVAAIRLSSHVNGVAKRHGEDGARRHGAAGHATLQGLGQPSRRAGVLGLRVVDR